MEDSEFNASEFCSRKLWQIVNNDDKQRVAESELREAIVELTTRKHYLEELARIGKLGGTRKSA